jgi:hypothetical protein
MSELLRRILDNGLPAGRVAHPASAASRLEDRCQIVQNGLRRGEYYVTTSQPPCAVQRTGVWVARRTARRHDRVSSTALLPEAVTTRLSIATSYRPVGRHNH